MDKLSLSYGSGLYELLNGPVSGALREVLYSKANEDIEHFKHVFHHLDDRGICCRCASDPVPRLGAITRDSKKKFSQFFILVPEKRNKGHFYNGKDVCLCKYVQAGNVESTLDVLDFSIMLTMLQNIDLDLPKEHVAYLRDYRNNFVGHASPLNLRLDYKEVECIWYRIELFTQVLFTRYSLRDDVKEHILSNIQDLRMAHGFKAESICFTVASSGSYVFKSKFMKDIQRLNILLNNDRFQLFEMWYSNAKERFADDFDMVCHLLYLHAHSFLHRKSYDRAMDVIEEGLKISNKCTNSQFFVVQMLTVVIRRCVNLNLLNELEKALEKVLQIITSDKPLFRGRVAGWVFFDQSRFYAKKMNQSITEDPHAADGYFKRAKENMENAIENFEEDTSSDGLHTLAMAKLELASLLLRCDGVNKEYLVFKPTAGEVEECKTLIFDHVEESSIPMDVSLKFVFKRAKCDYFYRKGNRQRFQEHLRALQKMARKSERKRWLNQVERREQFRKTT